MNAKIKSTRKFVGLQYQIQEETKHLHEKDMCGMLIFKNQ